MPEHRVANPGRWQAERDTLLAEGEEDSPTGAMRLTKMRQELPWVQGRGGLQLRDRRRDQSLADLFGRPVEAPHLPLHVRPPRGRPAVPSAPRSRDSIAHQGCRTGTPAT